MKIDVLKQLQLMAIDYMFSYEFFVKKDKSNLTKQTLIFILRYAVAPLCAATHGPTGAFDVSSNLADYPAKKSV